MELCGELLIRHVDVRLDIGGGAMGAGAQVGMLWNDRKSIEVLRQVEEVMS